MARDLAFPVEIVAGETLREADGLAMSSRNQYLSDEERPQATLIHRTLQAMREHLEAGRSRHSVEDEASADLRAGGFEVDYAAIRAPDLTEPGDAPGPRVALIAARLGRTRLIDNLEFSLGDTLHPV